MEQKSGTDLKTSRSDALVQWKLNLTLTEYERLAMRTAKNFGSMRENLMHAAMGLTSDAGEACGAIKAATVYGKPLYSVFDEKTGQTLEENIIEELGDTLWFIALAAATLGTSLDAVAKSNIEKLQKRYPDRYSDEAAIARADKS